MQKIKNKFLIFVLLIFIWVVFYVGIYSYFSNKVDRNTYIELLAWTWYLNDINLELNDRRLIVNNDSVKTEWTGSLLVISWGDWSITRIWDNSEIIVNETFVSDDKTSLNISFELLSWKSWSNVISFLWEWSYFKQYFNDNEASVRGTIYNIDLDNNYVYVVSHKIELLTNLWEILQIKEKQSINLLNFSFIKLEEFIIKYKDKSFDELNRVMDNKYFEELSKIILEELNEYKISYNKNIDKLTLAQKEEIYNKILSKYQDLNFISLEDSAEIFKVKIELKDELIKYSNIENQKSLVNSLVYDLKDTMLNLDLDSFKYITDIVKNNNLKLNIDSTFFDKINEFIIDNNLTQDLKNIFNKVKDSAEEYNPF